MELRRLWRPWARWSIASAVVAFGLLGCGATAALAPPTDNANGRDVGPLSRVDEVLPPGMEYGVLWSEIETQTPGCFFFSGPGELGRDTQLGDRGTFAIGERGASLELGSGIVFEGPRVGERMTLERSSSHDYDTGKWTVRETITLVLAPAGGWVGRYHYDEIEPGASTPGPCHIDASVLLGM